MTPHLQCAEQQVSPSNLTKYCACHAERLTYLVLIAYDTSFTMCGATGVTIQPHQILRLSREKTHILSLITYETSFTLRGATGVTSKPHQILRLSRKKTHILSPHHIWNLIYNARSNRCHHPTSPNTAPVTRKDSHTESSWHMKPHLQCAEQPVSPSNLTKYCACHAKRLTYWVLMTYETSFTVRGATDLPVQPHQILRLPHKIALQNFTANVRKLMKLHFQCGDDPRMIREWSEHDPTTKTQTATRLATEVTFRAHHEHFLL